MSVGSETQPAQIVNIIRLDEDTLYFLICRHQQSSFLYDPYALYPEVRARLWSPQVGELEVVEMKDIKCHFASLTLKQRSGVDAVAVLPLWRNA